MVVFFFIQHRTSCNFYNESDSSSTITGITELAKLTNNRVNSINNFYLLDKII